MSVLHLKIHWCIIRCLKVHIQQKPMTWLLMLFKRPHISIHECANLCKSVAVLTYIKNGKYTSIWCTFIHTVFVILPLSLAFMFTHSLYKGTVAKPNTLHSAEHQIIIPYILLKFTILSKVSNKV
jgi:hypothetical protein